jgi:hypothetical protein
MIPVNLEFSVGWKKMLLFPLSRYSPCVYLERMVTDSVVLGHNLEAYIFSTCQEFPCCYGTLMFVAVYRELCSPLPKKFSLRSFLKLPSHLRLCLYFLREFQITFCNQLSCLPCSVVRHSSHPSCFVKCSSM